jgi:hypothetical protein
MFNQAKEKFLPAVVNGRRVPEIVLQQFPDKGSVGPE